ncbi:ABC transporter ATP-binding protein [Anaerosalibacter massiliensis]|uniref:ABC transporter ATP-binding protein n=1 Tax=Anaerosalibacter massiliensis TaxID=1347392 RepID=A0A9X2S6C3_9FIRM|nr:ABC transporter ATP-binding protein [Anaerosalibacter massiliensis]MCR2045224.1 ABC transporter ATP-binding protein [Anaerosalibacter massiliensis]
MELKLENVNKKYKNKHAIKDVNLNLGYGVYGLLGENGAGKSTLMRILCTVDRQTSGEILFNNEDIFKLGDKYRELIGYMPQEYGVFPSFTARDYLEYIGYLKGLTLKELSRKVPEVLEFVNLLDVENNKVKTFSGGMKRRLGIAQAIINDPKILILDEPTAGLDPKERIRFSNIISDMSKDKLVILSTHIVSDIESIATNLIILTKGKIKEVEKIDKLVNKLNNIVWEVLVDQQKFSYIEKNYTVVRIKQQNGKILVRCVGKNVEVEDKKKVKPTLEDYYMYIGGRTNG